VLFARLHSKLRGYDNDDGVHGHTASLQQCFLSAIRLLMQWLNRRRQRHGDNWHGYKAVRKHFTVERPRIVGRPRPKKAGLMAEANMRKRVCLKSPVRENRTPGSVPGLSGNRLSYGDGVKHGGVHMTQAEISGISPFFIVSHVPSSLSFYRDRLGFEITFQGPAPDDIFFGIVRRGGAQILLKDVGVAPLPNYKRDVKKGIARWDAFVDVPDPDALAAEFASRNVEFSEPLKDTDDGLRGFELKDADGYVLFFGRPR
jgi:catechol 2,3-dioxygenase-like lactoylglutathione lyase family enzyme